MYPDDPLPSQAAVDAYLSQLLEPHIRDRQSLGWFARQAAGAYPTEVLRVLRQLGCSPEASTDASAGPVGAAASVLPLPHPLDFEWRFSAEGCRMLADRTGGLAHPQRIALIGAPGLAEVLPGLLPECEVTLFERRPEACVALASVEGLRIIEGDVADTHAGFGDTFDLVIADPPWYATITELFVRAASRVLRLGGRLLVCAPGLATRPGISTERVALMGVSATLGLAHERLTPAAVVYEAPPFELCALEAAGLVAFDPLWRRGDLFSYRLVSRPAVLAREQSRLPAAESSWREVQIERGRFRVDVAAVTNLDLGVDELVAGAIFDSVSNRDDRRANAVVWTSTNRVYRAGSPKAVLDELQAIASGIKTKTTLGVRVRRLVQDDLDHLARLGI